ncbi:acyl-CoA dehydrogenase [Chelatococcus asaccharovorans]|uniref:Alkylation response protein AidB-like acyl-CoA dehydrogenase n=1 Tax=Chelatococcus asaccharovorans TaxID=28210 RepID=A0A2V3UBV2_9HYPH|nr:acyl-CoA dehydrogenase [Chelatococcus asaccharovorans]MBS7703649.1 acyl-CoA dehydrogenase [Chelatococcus asaccharovorans]PXW61993.1 alkylation response protein AidB-like acyl-CoA dehydrogenase [Chelatococcus asaccharovorans]CAH1669389.1 putative acyl-CoA dehydrogenase FadE17 [Chelatococcus asaccharovorans]CAH1679184.1 putative acyl-CoA dehydrogenase FadE17 [Chelatococcus asaccharovorans]
MDFTYSPKDLAFRDELRGWLAANLPQGWGETVFLPEDEDENAMFRLDWERKLYKGGWNGIAWPKDYGGRGATLVEQAIFAEEMARAKAPEGLNIIGRNLVATTLLHHGSDAQKARFLPKIISGEEVWCQGFSEPNAGSDLAAVRCQAVRDGDHFVVNGQKIWTSFAQYSQWCILLARTDPSAPKHKGISFLLVDMKTPGITIRPLRQISGECEFNETFFDDVRVPVENLVGELNGGWRIAMTTLAYERGPEDALGRQLVFRQELDQLLATAAKLQRGNRSAIEDGLLRQKLAKSLVGIEIMRLNCLRAFSKSLKGAPRGAEASMNKLYWSHVMQDMFDTAMEVLGPLAPLTAGDAHAVDGGRFQLGFLRSKAFTIYSGSSEIQRNIIAERVLGLPK